eukprot:m51a1_g12270 hypothetical protein (305) ;mRNA; r:214520-215578
MSSHPKPLAPRQRVLLGSTNLPKPAKKTSVSAAPTYSRVQQVAPWETEEHVEAAPSPERLLGQTQSARRRTRSSPAAEEIQRQQDARGAVEARMYDVWEHAPPPAQSSGSQLLAPDPESPLFVPDEKRFVTTKDAPNERLDEEERRIAAARQQARWNNVRRHEAVIQDLLKDRDDYDEKKDDSKLTGFRKERELYDLAIERRRSKDRVMGPIKGARDAAINAHMSNGAAMCLAPDTHPGSAEEQRIPTTRAHRVASGSGVARCLDHIIPLSGDAGPRPRERRVLSADHVSEVMSDGTGRTYWGQ